MESLKLLAILGFREDGKTVEYRVDHSEHRPRFASAIPVLDPFRSGIWGESFLNWLRRSKFQRTRSCVYGVSAENRLLVAFSSHVGCVVWASAKIVHLVDNCLLSWGGTPRMYGLQIHWPFRPSCENFSAGNSICLIPPRTMAWGVYVYYIARQSVAYAREGQ